MVHSAERYILNPYQNFEIPIGVFVGKLAKLNESENLDTVDTQKLSTDLLTSQSEREGRLV